MMRTGLDPIRLVVAVGTHDSSVSRLAVKSIVTIRVPERRSFILCCPIGVPKLHSVGLVELAIVLLVVECVFDSLIHAAADPSAPTAALIDYVQDEAEGEEEVEAYSCICGVPLPVRQFKLFRLNYDGPSIGAEVILR